MRIEKEGNRLFRVTLTGYELSALISSARWATEGAEGELTDEAVNHLKQVLANYDNAASRIREVAPDAGKANT